MQRAAGAIEYFRVDSSTDSGCTPFTDDKMPGGVAWNGVEWAYGPELVCITSPDYPDDYPHNAECVYSVLVDELHTITVDFATQEDYDFLTINGVEYSGDGMNYGPGNALTGNVTLNTGDTISFTSDSYASERGFKICSYQGARSPADRPALPTPLVCAGRINENKS